MRNFLRSCLSLSLVFSLIYSPVVTSNAFGKTKTRKKFDEECSLSLSIMEKKVKAKCKDNGDTAECKEIKKEADADGGDQHLAYCVQADMARRAKNLETTKSVIYLAAATVCAVEAIAEKAGEGFPLLAALAAEAKAVCMATSIGVTAAGIVIDISGKAIINKAKDKYGEAKDQVCSVNTFTPLLVSLMPLMMNGAASGAAAGAAAGGSGGGSGSSNGGCLICALMMALQGGMSVYSASQSKKAQETFVDDANGVSNLTPDSVTNLTPAEIHLQQLTPDAVKPANSATTSAAATDSCANQGGNQYLVCLGQQDPDISAISASQPFLNQMQKSLHGKNLGDFVKGYDSESDLAQYVANGLGVSPALVSGVLANSEKITKQSGFLDNYKPSGYSRTAGNKPKLGGGDDMDFSKIMAGMMGKLDPGAPKDAKLDPAEQVFRKLELLPADKIEGNKDISLFARIAFRYRKNANNVEQLNWSRPENQSAPQKK